MKHSNSGQVKALINSGEGFQGWKRATIRLKIYKDFYNKSAAIKRDKMDCDSSDTLPDADNAIGIPYSNIFLTLFMYSTTFLEQTHSKKNNLHLHNNCTSKTRTGKEQSISFLDVYHPFSTFENYRNNKQKEKNQA